MNLHEFQAKELLRDFGVEISPFAVASSMEEVEGILDEQGWDEAVVKIQVHAGGRGKAGGVKIAKGKDQILKVSEKLLGMKMVNSQTGPDGATADQILLCPPENIESEDYLGIVIDRSLKSPVLIASPEGGVEIEVVAEKTPEKILTLPIDRDGYIPTYRLMELCKFMGWEGTLAKDGIELAKKLAFAFINVDASLLEINPLIHSGGHLGVLDAKISIDDNAIFRQELASKYYDPRQIPAREVEANEYDLAYIALEGNIGCMVNGAGLAMATMDIIKQFGGDPANFLDVGGSASKEKVAAGFRLILNDPQVKAIFVNIFGGIMDCATVAEGIISAVDTLGMELPLVVRLEGNNSDKGKKLLAKSSLNITPAGSMGDGAKKIIEAIKE
jgi:succinyl-CoA synthetase beta subunit